MQVCYKKKQTRIIKTIKVRRDQSFTATKVRKQGIRFGAREH